VEFEGTLENAALKECLWMENNQESQEGGNDGASQQHAKKAERENAITQLCPSKLQRKTIQP
jgi:stalled ribosome alternative rescue factor ArfA